MYQSEMCVRGLAENALASVLCCEMQRCASSPERSGRIASWLPARAFRLLLRVLGGCAGEARESQAPGHVRGSRSSTLWIPAGNGSRGDLLHVRGAGWSVSARPRGGLLPGRPSTSCSRTQPPVVDDLTHLSCDLCRAIVPRNLVRFHTLWHDSQTDQSTRFFGDQDLNPAVAQLLQVVAALRAVPPVTPGPSSCTTYVSG